jgi:formate/nitrite transporter FocA (FNT family)
MKVFMKVLMNKKVLAAIAGVLVALGTLFSTIGDTSVEETTEITEVVATE